MIIKIDASSQERREAKAAHELFTINAILVHAIGLTVLVSMAIILYTYFRTKKAKVDDVYLVYIHWQMSLNRYKILISAYVFYFLITSLGMVIGDNNVSSMDGTSIIESILTLLGIVPLFFAVLISAVLGSGSMFNAGRGEVDQKIAQKYPQ